jgi:hypothetical protein
MGYVFSKILILYKKEVCDINRSPTVVRIVRSCGRNL